jgi:hypothetical protein
MQRGPSIQQKRQRRGLLVFSELPILPSARSRSGSFHASLGCKPRSLIQISLGWFDYPNMRGRAIQLRLLCQYVFEGAVSSPLGAKSAEHRFQKLPNITNINIEARKEEGCAVSTQENAVRRELEREHLTRLSDLWTSPVPSNEQEPNFKRHFWFMTFQLSLPNSAGFLLIEISDLLFAVLKCRSQQKRHRPLPDRTSGLSSDTELCPLKNKKLLENSVQTNETNKEKGKIHIVRRAGFKNRSNWS